MTELSTLLTGTIGTQRLNQTATKKSNVDENTGKGFSWNNFAAESPSEKPSAQTFTGNPLSPQTMSATLSEQEYFSQFTVDLNDMNNEFFTVKTTDEPNSYREWITPDDAKFIRAATGVNLRVVNNLIMPFDDNGNFLYDPDAAKIAQTIAATIWSDRAAGRLVGEIDLKYVKGLIDAYKSAGMSFPLEIQEKMMAAVAKRSSAKDDV